VNPPADVRVTVTSGRRQPAVARHGPLLLLIVAAAVLAALALRSGHHAASGARAPRPQTPGAPGVAAAFRYPLGCLSVRIESGDPEYATARLNRASPCWRYGVYVTAIFRRVDGVWRLVLYARSNACPPRSLPAAVKAQVGVCTAANANQRRRRAR
jgi:hypothetical protein